MNNRDYVSYREGDWRLWALPDRWNRDLWLAVLDRINAQTPARHPHVIRFRPADSNEGDPFYLKIFDRASWAGSMKDVFRGSKALRSLRQGRALSKRGFFVPTTVCAGEQRSCRWLRRSFVLTQAVRGQQLPLFLRDRLTSSMRTVALSEKRRLLKQVALEVRRLHDLGFVHGDLVPTNIFVCELAGAGIRIFFMDNDRTRRYPGWLPHSLWKRNLVQLNRLPLPGISLQDRMRFLRHYLGKQKWSTTDCRLLRWLEEKTRRRREECDHIDARVSFRQLMRWDEKNV
jgi:hypothetical protein